ncbi:Invasion protein IalB, involved in pathogenesis [Roseivivax lentus]|uniref:Invasion protein IalB, involved in pathogenesis n=1 Tax=Roseivivax lentus TaxID=633194 RepID=A0A1N7LYQ9_9RHOB|nr:invasion associated locus B family protein [Roseivivax lentus]SIS78958.1 Invasion protein IalB, involved in pathogenesis [Roseivivax lentus]
MKTTLTHLSLIALLGATPALAQDSGTAPPAEEETGTPEASEAPAAEAPPIFDTGEPVTDEAAAAPEGAEDGSYVRETIGDWSIQCLRNPDGDDPCQLYQLLNDEDGNSVAEVSLFKVEGQGQAVAGANFIVPLETLLTQKLTMAVDGGAAKRYDFAFCAQLGCVARVGFTEADIAAFKRGAVANITIVPAAAPDQKVTVGMSLSGFTNSYDSVSASQ